MPIAPFPTDCESDCVRSGLEVCFFFSRLAENSRKREKNAVGPIRHTLTVVDCPSCVRLALKKNLLRLFGLSIFMENTYLGPGYKFVIVVPRDKLSPCFTNLKPYLGSI